MKQGFDLLRMVSNVIESAEERVTKILRSFKEAIVRHILTRVVPDSFGRIQFRPVRWKLEDFQIATVRFEPGIGFLFLDRKSTRLNSSHGYISYAVFCLKKKKKKKHTISSIIISTSTLTQQHSTASV